MKRCLPLLATIIICGLPAAAQAQTSRPAKPAAKPAAKAKPKKTLPPLGAPAGVFGEGVKLQQKIRLRDAVKQLDALKGKTIRIDGLLIDVCRAKGCWAVIKDGKHRVRVRFKDYGFFLPRDASGRRAMFQGVLSSKTISEEVAKHYARESGDPAAAKKIKGPQTVLSFLATGVEILGKRTLPPEAKPSPKAATKLAAQLQAAKKVGHAKGPVKAPVRALWLLRDLPGPRTQEFNLRTKLEAGGQTWWVFSLAKGPAFARGYAVRGDGEVFRF